MEITAVKDCTARDTFDAPDSFTQKGVKEWLISRGAKGIINHRGVATIIGCSPRVVKDAERAGELTPIDRCTYLLDDVTKWLLAHPRYIAQGLPKWEVDENALGMIRAMLLSTHKLLVRWWDNGDLEDLTHEVVARLLKKRRRDNVSMTTVVNGLCIDIFRELRTRMEKNGKTISLTNLEDEI